MRPIELTLSAFGSYMGTVDIDFTKLDENGIFLISGNTGAGKSTIFDAISFALFGEASGGLRSSAMLRSEYAVPTTKTYVKLRFECSGKEYTVERSLPYERKADRRKKDDNGDMVQSTTTQAANATLQSPGVPPVTSVKMVNQRIKDILGIDHDQFTKIAMIPQGEFQKLLQANNDSKQVILRRVFGTERFQKIEETIAKEVSEIDAKRKEKQSDIRSLVDSVKGDSESDVFSSYREALDSFIDPNTQLESITGLIGALINEDNNSLSEAIKTHNDYKEREITLKERKEKIKRNNDEKRKRETTIKEINELKSKLDGLRKEQEKNPQRRQTVDSKKRDYVLYERQIPIYPEYELGIKNLQLDRDKLTKNKEEIRKAQERRNVLNKEKESLETELKSLDGCELEKARTDQEGKDLQERINSLVDLKDRIKESETTLQRYDDAKARLGDLLIKKEGVASEYESAHTHFLCAQAGYMAEQLEEGKPCPVCGSIHHPSRAILPAGAPSEETVKQLKERYESIVHDSSEQSSICAGLEAEFKGKKGEAIRLAEKLTEVVDGRDYDTLKQNDCAPLNSAIAKLKERLGALRSKYQKEVKKCERMKDISGNTLPIINKEILNLSELIESDKSKEEEARIAGEEKRLADLRSSLSFDNGNKARKAIDRIKEEIDSIEKGIVKANEDVNTCAGEIREKEGVLQNLDSHIDNTLETDLGQVEKEIQENARMLEKSERKKAEADARLLINKPIFERLGQEKKGYASICQELAWKRNLSDTLRGTLSGKEKIELETFVLMSYFERILYKASIRLADMSSGQYELVRSETAGNLREKTGLGIAVKDHHSGKTRDVSSLSGGESFLASLALALGLSDETQSSSGGVRIDTMFIDEGFGSLSSDVLELALKTLERLAQKGTLIGLISHVDIMKDRYRRIDVEKTLDKGSTISIK